MASELSPRSKLYLKINDNLSEDKVKSLRLLLGNHIAKGKVQNATPHEMFTMLEADDKIREGHLELLKELLTALKEARLAKEAADLERDERRGKRKRSASEESDDDSPTGLFYRGLRGTRGRSGKRGRETHENVEFESDILKLHSKFGFRVEELKTKRGGKTTQGSSIPLILPNDLKYNASTGVVEEIEGVRRESLQIVPEALELLEGIQEPVSVMGICGPCRSGKSYILSRLLGTADAFQLGHLMSSQTFGIWMGTKVLRGKDFTIVLLDTEGIDAVGASAGQDASILVMTTLLSSHLIYNSLSVPHKGDLEKMQCFIQLAKGVTAKQGEKTQVSAVREFFPDFLWLLRDASLKMQTKDGKDMTPTEYLKTEVLEHDDDAFEESTSDKVGRAILTFFPSVECTTLERPSGDREVMENIAQHTDSLNPEFNKGVKKLTEMILLKSHAKRGYGKASSVSGVALSTMAQQYVEAVNDPNSIPALDNTWKNTVELMQNRAIEEAVREYNEQMQSQIATATNNEKEPLEESPENETHLKPVTRGRGRRAGSRARGRGGRGRHSTRNPPSQPTLMDLHNKLLNEVTDMLLKKVGHFGISSEDQSSQNQIVVDRMQKRLVQAEKRSVDYVEADGTSRKQEGSVVTGGELLHYIQKNKELSKIFCQDLLKRLLDPIRKHVESPPPDYDFDKLTVELIDARQQYVDEARGPGKWVVLQEMSINIEKLKAEIEKIKGYERKKMQEQQEAHEADLKAKKIAREMQQLRKHAKDLQQTQQITLQKMERLHRKQIGKMKYELEERLEVELQKIQDLQNAKLQKQAKIAKERLEMESSKTRGIIQRMEQEREDMSRQLEEMKDREKKKPPSPPPLDLYKQNQQLSKRMQDMHQTQRENLQKMERQYREQIERMKQALEEQHNVKIREIQDLKNAEMEEQAKQAEERLKNESSKTREMIQKVVQERADTQRQLEELKNKLYPPPPPPPRPQPSSSRSRRNRCVIS
ncbi:GBP6 [Branchiostoma lanceolatum]|uniref:GBP6 protein n=1 Tax=Branchiostoma lanceolatum TaxID=7740 RepID=A0A8J9ZB11_BRALA|nr:GBP6 [Branchiostoma lanceolatum]